MPVVILSGRVLDDIENKIGLDGPIYAGNHGMEWKIQKKYKKIRIPKQTSEEIKIAKQKLKDLRSLYPNTILEDKKISLSLHYRSLNQNQFKKFKKNAVEVATFLSKKSGLKARWGKKVLEVMPGSWDKGKFIQMIKKYLNKKFKKSLVPIYIGDDDTDEDAFGVLRSGISIRVGKGRSEAEYYVNNIREVESFLEWLNLSKKQ